MKEEMGMTSYTDNGDKAQVTFQNGDVHLPILSVARLSDHHDTLFHDTGGTLTHRKSKREAAGCKPACERLRHCAMEDVNLLEA